MAIQFGHNTKSGNTGIAMTTHHLARMLSQTQLAFLADRPSRQLESKQPPSLSAIHITAQSGAKLNKT